MKTIVLGLAPHLDKESFRSSDLHVFADEYAFMREGVLRCFTPNLASIAVTTCLHEKGYAAEYLDLVLEFGLPLTSRTRQEWLQRIQGYFAKSRPENVFISCVSATEHLTLKQIAPLIRKACPDAVIGVGSYHANALREKLLREIKELDFVFLGDIEPHATELMNRLLVREVESLAQMQNVVTRSDLGLSENTKRPSPNPSESRFSYRICDRYLQFYDSMPVVGMKGCPFNCSFCQEKIVRPGYHQRDPASVVAEAVDNYEAYEGKIGDRRIGYSFMEPVFGFDRGWTQNLLSAIEAEDLHFYWGAQTRVGQLDAEQIREMARQGCRIIFYGLESFSPRMLRCMNKTQKPELYLQSFKEDLWNCHVGGVAVEANIMFGYPGETVETLHENAQGIAKMLTIYPHTGVNLNLFRPLPGTKGLTDTDFGNGARLLVPDWWERGIAAGVTVLVQPSPQVGAADLLKFYRAIYDLANCYKRRGLSDDFARFMQLEELDRYTLSYISENIRQKVWQLTQLTPIQPAGDRDSSSKKFTGEVAGA